MNGCNLLHMVGSVEQASQGAIHGKHGYQRVCKHFKVG
jgi:hypothetical protein